MRKGSKSKTHHGRKDFTTKRGSKYYNRHGHRQSKTASGKHGRPYMGGKTHKKRKHVPWSGWSKQKPSTHQRTVMLRKCGKKCFLGPKKSFPICKKNTCKVSDQGLWAAYVRAKEWGKKKSAYRGKGHPTMKQRVYKRVARKSAGMLRRRGYAVGKGHSRPRHHRGSRTRKHSRYSRRQH